MKTLLKDIIKFYFLNLLSTIVIGLFLKFVLNDIIIQKYYHFSIFDQIEKSVTHLRSMRFFPFMALIVGPVFEELIFRLPLKLSKTKLCVSLSLFLFMLINSELYWQNLDYAFLIKLIASVLFYFLLMFVLKEEWVLRIQEKYFIVFFYTSSILFGLMHLRGVEFFNKELLYLYPIFALPQIISGVILGKMRLKHGIGSSIVLHSLMNVLMVVAQK